MSLILRISRAMGLIWSWLATVDEKKKISRQIDKEILQVRISYTGDFAGQNILLGKCCRSKYFVKEILQVRISYPGDFAGQNILLTGILQVRIFY